MGETAPQVTPQVTPQARFFWFAELLHLSTEQECGQPERNNSDQNRRRQHDNGQPREFAFAHSFPVAVFYCRFDMLPYVTHSLDDFLYFDALVFTLLFTGFQQIAQMGQSCADARFRRFDLFYHATPTVRWSMDSLEKIHPSLCLRRLGAMFSGDDIAERIGVILSESRTNVVLFPVLAVSLRFFGHWAKSPFCAVRYFRLSWRPTFRVPWSYSTKRAFVL